jgi:protein tyrosine phosphatase (PTP) superfamily phosphohydrolase (DUF442 family)
MPNAEQVQAIAQAGVNTVINLATGNSQGALQNEQEQVESQGMTYIHIPVEWDRPARQNLDDFTNAMDAHRDDHVLVHCQANFRATGFVALYRILRLGWGKDVAFSDLQKIWNPEKFPIWQKFIDENLDEEAQ